MEIFDLHCDTLYKMAALSPYSFQSNSGHVSEKGLIIGGYSAQCFAAYTPPTLKGKKALSFFKRAVNLFFSQIAASENMLFACCAEDIEKARKNRLIAAFLTVENAEFLCGSTDNIRLITDNKIRILGFVHNSENCLGYPALKQTEKPLKPFGCEIADALNSTNVYIDVSHLSKGGFFDVARLSKRPIIATHSAAGAKFIHGRNLSDEQIKIIANSGGVIGIPFYGPFLSGKPQATLADIISHLSHVINIGGEECAALGTDFDGIETPVFINGAANMQEFAAALIKAFGYNIAHKICCKNALRLI